MIFLCWKTIEILKYIILKWDRDKVTTFSMANITLAQLELEKIRKKNTV